MARLVAIGDSLTQGVQSWAITHTDQSYPALIAEAMKLGPDSFRVPNFRAKGGLPLNLEWIARRLEEKLGDRFSGLDWPKSLYHLVDWIDEVEDYWERGKGARPRGHRNYHNLAVLGFEVADAYQIDGSFCHEKLTEEAGDQFFAVPAKARLRAGRIVLNPGQKPTHDVRTQVETARQIAAEEGGIDHLLVWLGANNCLPAVVELDIRRTSPTPPGPDSDYTLWHPQAFEVDYRGLCDAIQHIDARHVYLATVPHVTIPPVTRGVMRHRGRLPAGQRYYDHYTHFHIRDKDFDPKRDPNLTGSEVESIDAHIDAYNQTIRREAEMRGWTVVDVCGLLDSLAIRRNHGTPRAALPSALSDLSVRFFEIDKTGKLSRGGLFSLDGIHPTACGYALVAQHFIDAINRHEEQPIPDIDFAAVRSRDLLVSHPPRTLDDIFGMLQFFERRFHLSRWLRSTR